MAYYYHIWVLFILAIFTIGSTAEEAKDISPIVKIGVYEKPPWQSKVNGVISGAEIQVAKLLMEKLELQAEFQLLPLKRIFYYLITGQIDIAIGLQKTADRESGITFLHPAYKTKSNKNFYVLKENATIISQYNDLYNLTIGVKRGAKYFERLDEDLKIRKRTVNSFHQGFLMLLSGRIDAYIITDSVGDYLVKKNSFSDKIVVGYQIKKHVPVFVLMSKKSPFNSQKKTFEEALAHIIEEGEVEREIDKYFKSIGLPAPDYR